MTRVEHGPLDRGQKGGRMAGNLFFDSADGEGCSAAFSLQIALSTTAENANSSENRLDAFHWKEHFQHMLKSVSQ